MAGTLPPQPPSRLAPVGLGLLVLAWGIQAIVTQSLLLREALVLMFGSELAWGIVLFAWLFGVAIGAMLGSTAVERVRRPDITLVIDLIALGILSCAAIWMFRGGRAWLGVEPGELLPLVKIALVAIGFVTPCSALVGLAFPLACRVQFASSTRAQSGAGPLGGVYAIESIGSLIGGAAFTFWAVEHWPPIQTAVTCGAITLVASGCLLATRVRPGATIVLGLLAIGAAGTAFCLGDRMNRILVERRWKTLAPGYELCAESESRYQNLAVGRRFDQFALYCDGRVSVDFPDPYAVAPQAHFWMCQHPDPRCVLVLGGGAEGLLTEILRYPVEHVDYVEPDPRQIETVEPFLPEADRAALRDPRVTVHHIDGRHFIKTQADRFDLVIARLPEPTSALRARFYTSEFYGELRAAMSSRAVLCTTATATPTRLPPVSARYLASIRATLAAHFPEIVIGWGDPAQILAATEYGLLASDGKEMARRYRQRRVESPWFDPLWFEGATDWLDPDKVKQRTTELDAVADTEISTDLRPIVYMLRLALWEKMSGGKQVQLTERLLSLSWRPVTAVLAMSAGLTLLLIRIRSGPRLGRAEGSVVLSVATTGLVTMALSIVWLFAFQNLYGYVYQRIGWIVALFMGGLVLGCGGTDRRAKRIGDPRQLNDFLWRVLIAVDLLLACLAAAAPALLALLGRLQTTPATLLIVEWSLSLLVLTTGVLGGAAFALAGGLQMMTRGRPGSAAGVVVGADHVGACLGALLTGVLLVPVLGTWTAAMLLAGVKLASMSILVAGRKAARVKP